MSTTHITLNQINTLPRAEAAALLTGLYEHSDWIAEQALDARPFASAAALKHAMVEVLNRAGRDAQVALVRAHPELAGKAMVTKSLTAESTNEQSKAGLTDCTPQEFAHIQQLNASYNAKFGFPFILAVRGPRGAGLTRQQIIQTFERRLDNHPDYELAECLRNIHRIVEIRLNDKLGYQPTLGHEVWDWHEWLAQFSDADDALTVTYLTDAHQKCARTIELGLQACGFDDVRIDAVGNVVGIYKAATENAKTLMTGSHYDTVRNGGKYDGRLGIFVPMACVRELARANQRLPFNLEVVAFAEEEGQRYKATFLGSGALVGDFKHEWLDQADADGVTMRQAMQQAGLKLADIPKLARDASKYLGFVEVHIEQGPVLNERDLPLGVVTSINGSVRFVGEVRGMASHAGTTPMDRRRDAAATVAELALYVEQRALRDRGADGQCNAVGTVGLLTVPNGSINVVPGRCQFSLDLRAPTNGQRDLLMRDVLNALQTICTRRGVHYTLEETMRASAAPSAPQWQARWEAAVQALGVPLFHLPSGAGHDAMKLHEVMPQAMLFVRGQNAGISHNPLESTTSDDMQLAIDAFMHLLHNTHA
ncbi:2-oxo-4-hydroxy-4-carboxy-5-ureidoimidazoline decarboxylase [Limnohabitans sp. JirII-31]|uniref:2-oxo-4-hydroxy-4-carboxy-5-ureidoimidazoline decarboxylase n=1 Tax=Limnohabitans sp. JirII-31 TaxID=1977908 RepID=UPI000C1E09F3|nr:2-oxo-4-hydroxy-4-carboxy-5-ureidoimidazoline decarboxylase [Limnohabitans sp. JirII-31]PIT73525.1 OHCU decarboxylase [Limnohabitans sp. JirII-31]